MLVAPSPALACLEWLYITYSSFPHSLHTLNVSSLNKWFIPTPDSLNLDSDWSMSNHHEISKLLDLWQCHGGFIGTHSHPFSIKELMLQQVWSPETKKKYVKDFKTFLLPIIVNQTISFHLFEEWTIPPLPPSNIEWSVHCVLTSVVHSSR